MRQSQVVFLKFLYFQFKFFLNFVLFFVVLRLPQFRFFFPIFQILADLRLSQVAQFFWFCFRVAATATWSEQNATCDRYCVATRCFARIAASQLDIYIHLRLPQLEILEQKTKIITRMLLRMSLVSQVGVLRELRLPQLEKKKYVYIFSRGLVVTMWRTAAWVEPLRRHAPVGGHHWSLGATCLGSLGDWLWELVTPRIHANPTTLWFVLPVSLGSVWVCHKLGNAQILRSWTRSWVLRG